MSGTALTPAQLEFLSEDEFVTIVPNFSQIPLQLISLSVRLDEFGRVLVDFGVQAPVAAFRPAVPVQVPLWLALHLRVQDKCRIRAPDWMQTGKLAQRRPEPTTLTHTHSHFFRSIGRCFEERKSQFVCF